ncbi:MAG: hypothetical protein ACXWAT_00040 [Methylobacter sp.]
MASTVHQNYEQLSFCGPEGCQARGLHRQIIGDAVATRTLLPDESGALCLFDRAAGVVYTLPTPVIGMQFEFLTTVSITSNAAKVITNLSTEFLLGEIFAFTTATVAGAGFAADGSTIRAISENGSTTGGLIGDRFIVTAISSTQWAITGVTVGSGTIATPFATS